MKKTLEQTSIVLPAGGGPTLSFMGVTIAYKVSGADTNGAWALLETVLSPNFSGMPLHWHEVTHHSFYVIEGKVTFQIGERIFLADRGAFVSVPAGVLHTFRNEHDQPARILEIIIPGGFEGVFKELVAMNANEPALLLKPHKLIDLYKRYDTFMPDEIKKGESDV